jgi:hypothetical protein
MTRWKTASALTVALALVTASSFAAAKTYQVTGPVIALTDDTITVKKGNDPWEIARDATTKIPAGLKVGDKVTIEYRMSATSVDVKPAAAAKASPKPAN